MSYDDIFSRYPDLDDDIFSRHPDLYTGFDSPDLMTTFNTQAFQDGGDFAVAVETGSIAQNLTAEPEFLSTAAGQQLLLKGGLMLAQMVLGAIDKPKQPTTSELDMGKQKEIRKRGTEKYFGKASPKKKKKKKR